MWVVDTPVQWYRFLFLKNTGECYGMKAQKERWEKGDVPDNAMSIMNSDLPLPRVHFAVNISDFLRQKNLSAI